MKSQLVIFVVFWTVVACACQTDPELTAIAQRQKIQGIRNALLAIAKEPSDPCEGPITAAHPSPEQLVFENAADNLSADLSELPSDKSPLSRARESLGKMETLSNEINQSWPAESRFKWLVFDLHPLLVIKMSIRGYANYSAYGLPQQDYSNNPNTKWKRVISTSEFERQDVPRTRLEIHPLFRGPNHNARFLAEFTYEGCAGSYGVGYDAEEWNPSNAGSLYSVIELKGAFGLIDDKDPFAPIGELRTEGKRITMPYCWFSAVDFWDNPSMCALDTYDLAANDVRFVSRQFNRPDLLPISKAIEYAEQRDYFAVLAYCESPDIARRLTNEMPVHVFAERLGVKRFGQNRERVELSNYRFIVEKRVGRWLITSFSTAQ
jgi:hypothetical protein